MKNRIYKYIFYEFIGYFLVVLFAFTAIIWTIQAINFLDLVTDDGHAFRIYLFYSSLIITKILTKLIPFSFLIALMLTILKLEKDNELLLLWTSGLNKIRIVNLFFRISLLVMAAELIMGIIVTPEILKTSRALLKNSELQFVPSLLKEKQFNDTVEGLTIFVDEKVDSSTYKNIFIRDDKEVLTKTSSGSSTIFAKSGYVSDDKKSLVLINGNIQKLEANGNVTIISFEKTTLILSGLSTKTIGEIKIQETPTVQIIRCLLKKINYMHNCDQGEKNKMDSKIEINKRFGIPIFIPLIALIICFLLSTRKEEKMSGFYKYIYFIISFSILIASEILVRYSGISWNHTAAYYLFPILLLPIIYLLLIKKFKYENLY